MSFFLVFFPEEQQHFKSNSTLKRTNSNKLFTRTQSTISICALLIFVTFLLFTLSSFEPNNDFISTHQYRRFLTPNVDQKSKSTQPALQGLGSLYTRGTNAMNELVICHVSEHVTLNELKLFIRAFHGSGLASKSDLLFIFDSISTIDGFNSLIRDESEIFLNFVRSELGNQSNAGDFPVTGFVKSGKDSVYKEPIWGKQIKNNNYNNSSELRNGNVTRASYGSIVGFGSGELDPENSLSGFLDRVPMNLRRWASYPMILGRVRRKFKRIMLVDVKDVLLLGDPLGRVKTHSPESIFLFSTQLQNTKTHRKNTKSHRKSIIPSVIIGGERGVRRLSGAMLTEIVRTTTRQHHNKKNSITESGLLNQLVGNEFLQKSIRFVVSSESIPDPSSLGGLELANQTVVRRGNSNFDSGVIMKHICSFSIYTDC